MKRINLLLLMVFFFLEAHATSQNVSTPRRYIVLHCNETAKTDTLYMDSAQIVNLKRFLSDTLLHYQIDSIIQNSNVEIQEKVEEHISTKLWVRILLFSLAFLLVLNALYLILRFRGLRDEIVDVVRDSGRIKEWLNNSVEKPSSIPVSKSYDRDIQSLQNENRDLKNRVAVLEDSLREKKDSSGVVFSNNPQSSSRFVEAQKQLYADSIIDGVFSHVREQENDDTVFVLKLKNEANASITLYRGAYNKVLANASYLEGCEKQIMGSSTVEITREGEAERGADGKWRVITSLKVEIR